MLYLYLVRIVYPDNVTYGMGRFPSGQRGQTVNLLQIASVVRIHLGPLEKPHLRVLASVAFAIPICYTYLLSLSACGGLPLDQLRSEQCLTDGNVMNQGI